MNYQIVSSVEGCAGIIDGMVGLGRIMHKESAFRDLSFSESKLFRYFSGAARNPDWFVSVAHDGDDLVGMVVGQSHQHFFGDDLVVSDALWYVAKEHRGSAVGVRLLQGFETWARGIGAKEIGIGISTGITADRTGHVLVRLGFSSVGGIYKKRF